MKKKATGTVRTLLEKVKQFNEGNYEMEAGILEFPMQKLELMLRKGEVREGSFFVTSRYANPIHGYIYSSHFPMVRRKASARCRAVACQQSK